MSLTIGNPAPDFSLLDSDGAPHSLADHKGRKVMLSFYRSAECPFCNYAIDELQGRYKKLAWASNLDVVAVFQSPTKSIDNYVLKPRDTVKAEYPFHLLADPELMTYREYMVKEKSKKSFKELLANHQETKEYKKYIKTYLKENDVDKDNYQDFLPSDFLIDENGIIVDYFRAKVLTEHIPLDRIEYFLFFGKKKEEERSLSISMKKSLTIKERKPKFSSMTMKMKKYSKSLQEKREEKRRHRSLT
mmetsp:Transcript_62163/g.92181  ORF Transcript_62163/g.92181 Transcript_62163/m.92181 type:complete len:246 (-) Transcript_62163:449-1186(-)